MGYQDLPWEGGSSQSFKKLVSLSLPVLQGKSVLDVGCNTGYFCGWAHFQRAAFVRGIDSNPDCIRQARLWFPACRFSATDWARLGPETYDLILLLSALHYAEDQQALIDLLMSRLNPGGILVLEAGIADGDEDGFVPVRRSIHAHEDDLKWFPTLTKMRSMLQRYVYKQMGVSVTQRGDPVPRQVFHIQPKRPLAILFMDKHYSGKSSVAGDMLQPGIFIIHGETLYDAIHDGTLAASDALKQCIRLVPGTAHKMPPRITEEICANGSLPELAAICFGLAGRRDFVLEHYIPVNYRLRMADLCEQAGYFVVDVALYDGYMTPWRRKRPPYKQYTAYQTYLEKISHIDEEAYLTANPDVARAVAEGTVPSATQHYWRYGKLEKRKLR